MTTGKATKGQTIQLPQEKLQKDRQYNDQKKSYKRTDNTMTKGKATKEQTTIDKTYCTYKTKDRVKRTPLKTGGELKFPERVSSSCSTSDTHRVNIVYGPVCHPQKCFMY
jgi:hypothetical protein